VCAASGGKPVKLTASFEPMGSYAILDHLWFGAANSSDTDFGIVFIEGNSHHYAVRYSDISGNLNRSTGVILGTWSYSGSQENSYIVVDHNYIHDIGDVNATSDQDANGVDINGSDSNIWITYNTFSRVSGDSTIVEAQDGRKAKIHHVYFGKNQSDHNRQSGGYIKNATDVIFSQNTAHDFRVNSGGPGNCYGTLYDSDWVWFIDNECHAANIGIAIAGASTTPGSNLFILGNLIHDLAEQGTNVYENGAVVIRGYKNAIVANNTFARNALGINMPPDALQTVTIQNNIFAFRTNSGTADLYTEGGVTMTVTNNLYTNPQFTGASAGTNAITADPLFVSTSDYHLQSGSPAINKGVVPAAYAAFQSRYGIDISKDIDNKTRPGGSGWDIGAYESDGTGGGGGGSTPPQAPTNVHIIG